MSEGKWTKEIPRCIFCGKDKNVFGTGKYGIFYSKRCDTTFEPIELLNCPKCKKNDEVTTGHRGHIYQLQPASVGNNQY